MIYGHYDVQPAGPGWSSDPFTPVVRAGVLYARGAGDDKGQIFAHLCALDAWRQVGIPPVQVLVIAEGAEEVGSPGFHPVLRRLARRVRPRAVVVSDTERDDDGAPTVTVSQRGHLVAQLEVDTGGADVHPGRSRRRRRGSQPGAGRGAAETARPAPPPPWHPPEARRRPGAHPHRPGRGAGRGGGRATIGPRLDERITRRGALSVTRLATGARGGAVPARSAALIDLRLPPRADPVDVSRRARQLLDGLAPRGTSVRLRVVAGTAGAETTPDALTRQAAHEACAAGFGRPPAYVRSGGTVPAVGMMARAFGIRPLLLGFGTPGGNAHGPDEAMDLPGWAAAVDTSAVLLSALARPPRSNHAVRPAPKRPPRGKPT